MSAVYHNVKNVKNQSLYIDQATLKMAEAGIKRADDSIQVAQRYLTQYGSDGQLSDFFQDQVEFWQETHLFWTELKNSMEAGP